MFRYLFIYWHWRLYIAKFERTTIVFNHTQRPTTSIVYHATWISNVLLSGTGLSSQMIGTKLFWGSLNNTTSILIITKRAKEAMLWQISCNILRGCYIRHPDYTPFCELHFFKRWYLTVIILLRDSVSSASRKKCVIWLHPRYIRYVVRGLLRQ